MERTTSCHQHQPALFFPSQQQHQHKLCHDGIFLDVPSDITVELGGRSFTLHKFPLVSRSGRIRKLIAEQRDAEVARVELLNLPGGAESFELAAKFCYGLNFEITATNVAQLLCVSKYLEMTEDYANENLASFSEAYLDGVVFKNLEMCIKVLQQCESLLPLAEELKIVGRCIDAISSKACAEQIASSFSRLEYSSSGRLHMNKLAKCSGEQWIEDLSILRIDIYQRVIETMKCRGVHPDNIGASVMNYAEKLFKRKPIISHATSNPRVEPIPGAIGNEEKIVVEAIACLLPVEKLTVPISFLFGLLRSAIMLNCMMSCRLNLERIIGLHLEMATLDDLLMPYLHHAGDTLFDVDTVHRILLIFCQQENSEDDVSGFDSDDPHTPSQTALVKVAKLVENYLAEIAPDSNLKLAKFISIADTLPGYVRSTDDGLYRAVDIYLKAHQGLSDSDRKRLCKLLDFKKLSEDASAHAAQNDRLPVQATVQVLYMEQLRLRNALCCSFLDDNQKTTHQSCRISSETLSAAVSPRDNYASLRRENRELKLELARMRMRLNDLEKGHACMKQDLDESSSLKLLSSISRKFGKLNFFGHIAFKGSSSPSTISQTTDTKIMGRP